MKRFALLLSFFWLNYLAFAQNPEEVFKDGMAKMEASCRKTRLCRCSFPKRYGKKSIVAVQFSYQ